MGLLRLSNILITIADTAIAGGPFPEIVESEYVPHTPFVFLWV